MPCEVKEKDQWTPYGRPSLVSRTCKTFVQPKPSRRRVNVTVRNHLRYGRSSQTFRLLYRSTLAKRPALPHALGRRPRRRRRLPTRLLRPCRCRKRSYVQTRLGTPALCKGRMLPLPPPPVGKPCSVIWKTPAADSLQGKAVRHRYGFLPEQRRQAKRGLKEGNEWFDVMFIGKNPAAGFTVHDVPGSALVEAERGRALRGGVRAPGKDAWMV